MVLQGGKKNQLTGYPHCAETGEYADIAQGEGRRSQCLGKTAAEAATWTTPHSQEPPGEAGGGPDKTGETRQSAQNNTPDHRITQRTPEVSRGRSGCQDGPSLRPAGATDT